ncbi:MAG: hypothetical protein JST47_13710 [Bacteroidetes bacterium]|nr:hypothetical protein [Bacteroidota bacterium]MBS1973059.1 hypothetical protein [Bacteroidota bacterium]
MDTFLLALHNLLRWAILILLVFSIIKSFSGWKNKRAFTAGDRKIWLFTLISAHITLLIGLYQLCFGRYGIFTTGLPAGTKLMKDTFYRFYWIEHPFGMIVSVVLITIGYGVAKKQMSDEKKFKKAFWLFLVALIIILATVPWPFRQAVGRPWLPGM